MPRKGQSKSTPRRRQSQPTPRNRQSQPTPQRRQVERDRLINLVREEQELRRHRNRSIFELLILRCDCRTVFRRLLLGFRRLLNLRTPENPLRCISCKTNIMFSEQAFFFCFCRPVNPQHVFHQTCIEEVLKGKVMPKVCNGFEKKTVSFKYGFPGFNWFQLITYQWFKLIFYADRILDIIFFGVGLYSLPGDWGRFVFACQNYFNYYEVMRANPNHERVERFVRKVALPFLGMFLSVHGIWFRVWKFIEWTEIHLTIRIDRQHPRLPWFTNPYRMEDSPAEH